jgi:hypothetical protein
LFAAVAGGRPDQTKSVPECFAQFATSYYYAAKSLGIDPAINKEIHYQFIDGKAVRFLYPP